jgi:hypothetical protein
LIFSELSTKAELEKHFSDPGLISSIGYSLERRFVKELLFRISTWNSGKGKAIIVNVQKAYELNSIAYLISSEILKEGRSVIIPEDGHFLDALNYGSSHNESHIVLVSLRQEQSENDPYNDRRNINSLFLSYQGRETKTCPILILVPSTNSPNQFEFGTHNLSIDLSNGLKDRVAGFALLLGFWCLAAGEIVKYPLSEYLSGVQIADFSNKFTFVMEIGNILYIFSFSLLLASAICILIRLFIFGKSRELSTIAGTVILILFVIAIFPSTIKFPVQTPLTNLAYTVLVSTSYWWGSAPGIIVLDTILDLAILLTNALLLNPSTRTRAFIVLLIVGIASIVLGGFDLWLYLNNPDNSSYSIYIIEYLTSSISAITWAILPISAVYLALSERYELRDSFVHSQK